MSKKPVIPRASADHDAHRAIDHYLSEGAEHAASGFIDALSDAYSKIARNPALGSPRFAHELDLPGLRTWPLKRYPHLVFYLERATHIDVWRVLHPRLDIPGCWAPLKPESPPHPAAATCS